MRCWNNPPPTWGKRAGSPIGYGLVNAQAALEMATPTDAEAPGPSHCIEIECGAAAALSGEADEWQQLTTLRAVRDEVFARHPNIAWTDIYYRHQAEVFWLVMSDSTLRDNARTAIRTLNPALNAAAARKAAMCRSPLKWCSRPMWSSAHSSRRAATAAPRSAKRVATSGRHTLYRPQRP
ncbi:MAG: hypothetical protein R2911_23405 [Caldilineaceae bacterium]